MPVKQAIYAVIALALCVFLYFVHRQSLELEELKNAKKETQQKEQVFSNYATATRIIRDIAKANAEYSERVKGDTERLRKAGRHEASKSACAVDYMPSGASDGLHEAYDLLLSDAGAT